MEGTLDNLWAILNIPAFWGSILTITMIVLGVAIKRLFDHALESQLEKIREIQTQDKFIRELYADSLRKYSSNQAQSLRQAYLLLFEPHSSSIPAEGLGYEEKLEKARQTIMGPLREQIGWLDEATIKRINRIQNYLAEFKGSSAEELEQAKVEFFDETELARQFVKSDRIAYRLGLINRPIKERNS